MNDPLLERALSFAVRVHAGQWREGEMPLPYVTHPVQVTLYLRYVGGETDPNLLAGALLHDTIEESETTAETIEAEFGTRVREIVVGLTRYEPTTRETAGMSKDEIWSLRAGLLLDEIAAMTPEVQRVKLADRLDNVRGARRLKVRRKLERYLGQTRRILEIVPRGVNPGLWDAIESEVVG